MDDITQDDLLAEIAAWVQQNSNERPGKDWFTTRELQEKELPEMTLDKIRNILDGGVKQGIYEKITFGRSIAYYHKVK